MREFKVNQVIWFVKYCIGEFKLMNAVILSIETVEKHNYFSRWYTVEHDGGLKDFKENELFNTRDEALDTLIKKLQDMKS